MKPSTKLRYLGIGLMLALIAATLFIFYKTNPDSFRARKGDSSAPPPSAPYSQAPSAVTQAGAQKLPEIKTPIQPDKQAAFDEALCHDLANSMKNAKGWPAAKKKLEIEREKADLELKKMLSMSTQNPEPRSKAAALFLHAQMRADQIQKNFSRQHPECAADQPCMDEAREAANLARLTEIDEIAKLAAHSPDPQLYAQAFHACNSLKDNQQGFCNQISAAQWTQRDPENGSAWLFALTQAATASKGKHNGATEAALFRLSQVKKFDLGLSLLSELKRGAPMQSENVFVRQNLLQLAAGTYFATALPGYQHTLSYCKGEALADANRRHTCDQIAAKLTRDEGSMIGLAIGLKMGENLAWAPEKIADLREELDALNESTRSGFDGLLAKESTDPATQELQVCLWMVRNTNRIENIMQHGEVWNLKNQIAKQKTSRAELAAAYRKYKKELLAKAEAEKSAKQ